MSEVITFAEDILSTLESHVGEGVPIDAALPGILDHLILKLLSKLGQKISNVCVHDSPVDALTVLRGIIMLLNDDEIPASEVNRMVNSIQEELGPLHKDENEMTLGAFGSSEDYMNRCCYVYLSNLPTCTCVNDICQLLSEFGVIKNVAIEAPVSAVTTEVSDVTATVLFNEACAADKAVSAPKEAILYGQSVSITKDPERLRREFVKGTVRLFHKGPSYVLGTTRAIMPKIVQNVFERDALLLITAFVEYLIIVIAAACGKIHVKDIQKEINIFSIFGAVKYDPSILHLFEWSADQGVYHLLETSQIEGLP